jgi:hypothetical protein
VIFIQVFNHGLTLDDLKNRRGAKLAKLGVSIQNSCLDVVSPGHRNVRHPEPGQVMVDFPFNLTFGGGEAAPLVVLVEILAWPQISAGRHEDLMLGLANSLGDSLCTFYSNGRKVHISVRDADSSQTWTS